MPIQKRTALQMAASRRNGARSRGPLSDEGKANSARNALEHGLTAKTLLTKGESHERFNTLLRSLVQQFAPQTDAEFLCIEEMASAKWRIRRAWSLESVTLGRTTSPSSHPVERAADAWGQNQSKLESYHRYESRLLRDYERSLGQLRDLQCESAIEEAEIEKLRNEPDHTPASGPFPPNGGQPARPAQEDIQ